MAGRCYFCELVFADLMRARTSHKRAKWEQDIPMRGNRGSKGGQCRSLKQGETYWSFSFSDCDDEFCFDLQWE